jgi:XTP/dITP diphosphohydrolase
MRQILIATQNKGKLIEIKALLDDVHLELVTPDQIGIRLTVEEDGLTYQENAEKKARAYATASGILTLADDSGLEVEALGGQPGLHSARFSGKPGATDADRRSYLLELLNPHPQPWRAQFRCIAALHDPQGGLHFSEGVCPGVIIPEERGEHGFGYDPIFQVNDSVQTMAELSMEEKNRLSHRARAIAAIKPVLFQLVIRHL